jgi:hypothetical protein
VAAGAAALMGTGLSNPSPFQVDSTSTAEYVELKSVFEYRDSSSNESCIAPKRAMAFPVTGRSRPKCLLDASAYFNAYVPAA